MYSSYIRDNGPNISNSDTAQDKEVYVKTKELKKFGLLVQEKFEKIKLQKNV